MNSEQRRALRLALVDQGFKRDAYTQDSGDGRYTETWGRYDSPDVVTIEWGEKARP